MDADSASHLCQAADGCLDLFRSGHHQVCELVDDYHHAGKFRLSLRFELPVVTVKVANAELRELL